MTTGRHSGRTHRVPVDNSGRRPRLGHSGRVSADELPALIRTTRLGPRSREAQGVRRAAAAGELVRVHRGVYVDAAAYAALTPCRRHVLSVQAIVPGLGAQVVVSHASAAALHGLPRLGDWPRAVHVVDDRRGRDHVTPAVATHAGVVPDEEARVVTDLRVTSPARTAADLALASPFADAVVALDAVLHRGLATAADVERVLARRASARSSVSAARALAFASAGAESAGESLCRVVLHRLGAPPPVLQRRFAWGDRGQFADIVDFWWPEYGLVLEFDGVAKYTEARWRRGRTASQIVVDEKVREDRIRLHGEVRGFARCVWADLMQPERLAVTLRAAGLPLA